MNLTELRAAVGAALADVDPDVYVHAGPVDALSPPAYLLQWSDPWLEPASWCQSYTSLDVVAVVPRLEPEAQYETLEMLVQGAYAALHAARLTPSTTATPLPTEIGSVSYLAAKLRVREPVDLPAPANGRNR